MRSLLKTARRITRIMIIAIAALVATGAIAYSVISQYSVPPYHEIQNSSNVSSYYNVSYKKTIKKSRQSTVQIISILPEQGMISAFSGTYFESYGGYFVVSVAHGINGPCENTKIVHNENVYDCKKYIHIDQAIDYSIIQVEEIPDRVPIQIPRDLPKNRYWAKSYSLLNKVLYTGFPNNLGPLTIGGEISGYSPTGHAYVLSYAWQGSSGSGVFDHSGRYIGYVVAIDVGQTELGVQILQNVVLVMPAYNIDWTKAITEAE